MDRARGLLTRMGYASGLRDAELARTRAETCSDLEAFMTGPQLHTLEGIVHVTPVKIELDRASGRFYGEFLWENSWEGQWHRHHYGIHHEPVCWTQIGYACGYTSAFMGRPILYKETECAGMGHPHCRIIGKPVEQWDDAAAHMRYFKPEAIADQLIELQTQVVQLRSTIAARDKLPSELIGSAPAFTAACELLAHAAASQITVLLLGETGVGKEMFARALHAMGSRRERAFVAMNCAAIPNDLVESELFGVEKGAYTGALLTRAGPLRARRRRHPVPRRDRRAAAAAQSKLLRALQEGEIERLGDHRTRKRRRAHHRGHQRGPAQRVKDGRFRSDLYYRLNAYQVPIPPLRERKEDISPLAKRFLEKYCAVHAKKLRGFTDKAKRALLSYPWPGNIRELQNMVERGVILAPSGTRIEVDQPVHVACSAERAREFGLDQRRPRTQPAGIAGRAVRSGVQRRDDARPGRVDADRNRGRQGARQPVGRARACWAQAAARGRSWRTGSSAGCTTSASARRCTSCRRPPAATAATWPPTDRWR
jgi:transcriptional regulator with AAA-type ATPase domain